MKGNAHAEPGKPQPPPIVAIPPLFATNKSHLRGKFHSKDVKNEGRSDYVHENK
jgi:hypothetical protein